MLCFMTSEPITAEMWAAIAAFVAAGIALLSTAVTLWLQWWRAPKALWAIEGLVKWSGPDAYNTQGPEQLIADLTVLNVGDGSAYNVVATWNQDGQERSARMAGVIAPGGSFPLRLFIPPDYWESASLRLEYRSAPTRWRSSGEQFKQRRVADLVEDGLLVRDGSWAGAPHFSRPISDDLQERLSGPN